VRTSCYIQPESVSQHPLLGVSAYNRILNVHGGKQQSAPARV